MKKKILIIITMSFILQTIISCCDCDSNTYENIYTNVDITPIDTSGFKNEVVIDKVYKNAFGLDIFVDFDSNIIANNNLIKFSDFGFSSALAITCDCSYEYVIPDPISNLIINIYNQSTKEKIEITDWFKIYSYTHGLISLEDFFKNREQLDSQFQNSQFQMELIKYELIPNSVIFEVNILLESGKLLKNQTEIVNFFE